jgi:hypothetical protein
MKKPVRIIITDLHFTGFFFLKCQKNTRVSFVNMLSGTPDPGEGFPFCRDTNPKVITI